MGFFSTFALDLINGVSSEAKVADSQTIIMRTEEEEVVSEDKEHLLYGA